MYYPGELDLIIKRDLPVVAAERKILDKLVLDLDTVKSRLDKVIIQVSAVGIVTGLECSN